MATELHYRLVMRSIALALMGLCMIGCGAGPDAAGQNESTLENAASAPTKGAADQTPLPDSLKCVDVGRYQATGSAVIDTASSGKLWQRLVDPSTRTQPEAATYCANVNVEGLTGWRLPSVAELGSIRYKPSLVTGGAETCSPSIDQSAFPDTPASLFWTSTARPLGDAYYTNFADGRSHGSQVDEPMFVRCVHDAPGAYAPLAARVAD